MDEIDVEEYEHPMTDTGDKALDRADIEILRGHVLQYLDAHVRNYEWWKNPLTYCPWMDDLIAEYESNKSLYDKLTKMLEDMEA